MKLPEIEELRMLAQSLAMCDAILSPEWEYRYYSFNCAWDRDEMMASMRDGCGDHWFLHFTTAGAFLKGFAHESPMAKNAPRPGVLDSVPSVFRSSLDEPAFIIEDSTFCLWREVTDNAWHRGQICFPPGADPDGSSGLLGILLGGPDEYREWAEGYYERQLPQASVEAIFRFQPITSELVLSLNTDASFENILSDALEIGYPVG
jgi:hypothetical protein